ncbi:hypothetical protein NLI96_g4592 [Meripilus lineatus]|uniref:C2H2-type domain-containing protein n=1 Tax=Meripilus lineatus TaxID=2056292 RepID=A0AAD5YEM2_9APHY|nr:hypothetical protein NLI96_g4592 [Physisporinus lineatus]
MDSALYVNMFTQGHPLSLATHHKSSYSPKDTSPQSGPVYLRQHRTIELIELIEVPAPPPRQQPSTITSSEASSSPYTESCSSSEFDSEEDESAGSSYCSSDEEDMAQRDMPLYDDTYRTRLNRVLAWRDGFSKSSAAPSGGDAHASLSHQKRKVDHDSMDLDDQEMSQSPKRSRSIPPPEHRPSWPHRRLSAHSCSACDACFATRQSLRQHARDLEPSDPCRVAVEYGFES